MPTIQVYLLMLITIVFWAGAFIAGKVGMAEFSAWTITAARFWIAVPCIFLVLKWMQPHNMVPNRQQLWPIIGLGLGGTFLYHILFFMSMGLSTAINASVIGASMPGFTALFAIFLLKERITPLQALGMVLAFVGVLAVASNGSWYILSHMQFNTGDLYMLAAVLCFSLYSISIRVAMLRYKISPYMMTAYTFLTCAAAATPFGVYDAVTGKLDHVSMTAWLSVAYMAVFASVMGYLFQMISVRYIGPARTSIFMNLTPVFATIMAYVFLGETITLHKEIFALLILGGVYLTTRRPGNA